MSSTKSSILLKARFESHLVIRYTCLTALAAPTTTSCRVDITKSTTWFNPKSSDVVLWRVRRAPIRQTHEDDDQL